MSSVSKPFFQKHDKMRASMFKKYFTVPINSMQIYNKPQNIYHFQHTPGGCFWFSKINVMVTLKMISKISFNMLLQITIRLLIYMNQIYANELYLIYIIPGFNYLRVVYFTWTQYLPIIYCMMPFLSSKILSFYWDGETSNFSNSTS